MEEAAVTMSLETVLGSRYLIDGISLLARGAIAGLVVLHESATVEFIVAFLLRTVATGALFVVFGYALATGKPWSRGGPGYLLALWSLPWGGLSALGGDIFTAFRGGAFLLLRLAPGSRGRGGNREG